jgi:hypothetical protein
MCRSRGRRTSFTGQSVDVDVDVHVADGQEPPLIMRAAWSSQRAIECLLDARRLRPPANGQTAPTIVSTIFRCIVLCCLHMPMLTYALCRNMPKIKPQQTHDYPTQAQSNRLNFVLARRRRTPISFPFVIVCVRYHENHLYLDYATVLAFLRLCTHIHSRHRRIVIGHLGSKLWPRIDMNVLVLDLLRNRV